MGYKKSDGKDNLSRQYQDLMERCNLNLEHMDSTLPPAKEDLNEALKENGITRRSFVKWSSMMTAALMLPPVFSSKVAAKSSSVDLPSIPRQNNGRKTSIQNLNVFLLCTSK